MNHHLAVLVNRVNLIFKVNKQQKQQNVQGWFSVLIFQKIGNPKEKKVQTGIGKDLR